MNLSESKRAVRLFDGAERVYVSVLLPLFQGLHATLMMEKPTSRRKARSLGAHLGTLTRRRTTRSSRTPC